MDSDRTGCELLPGIVSILQGEAKVSSTLLGLWVLAWQGFISWSEFVRDAYFSLLYNSKKIFEDAGCCVNVWYYFY